ncbi:hypothetical protein U14_01078 [Candidatus Moduliflexus flocculans]|uniref:Uncharacterized protein n=1 Tax=Candidatus Moduliflexus flocculans TaxID=1499966 RepID=A0A0S6VY71_9BACT|nr:hypothetical protein U14_01078 [Candidatus Moduliflexus flocculans]
MPTLRTQRIRVMICCLLFISVVSCGGTDDSQKPTPTPAAQSNLPGEPTAAPSPQPTVTPSPQLTAQQDAQRMVVLLNYLQIALLKVAHYQDRVMLDGEYRHLLTNIKLSTISDQALVAFLNAMAEQFKPFLLTDQERRLLDQQYQEFVVKAIYADYARQTAQQPGLPMSCAAAALVRIGAFHEHYRQHLAEYRQALDKSVWELPAEALQVIRNSQSQFSEMYWRFIKQHQLPDTLNPSEDRIQQLIKLLDEQDQEKRLRLLQDMQTDFAAFPPLWHALASLTAQILQPQDALPLYQKFDEANINAFKYDHESAEVLMERLLLNEADMNTQETLQHIIALSPDDWRKNLFVAFQAMKHADYQTARDLIRKNRDFDKDESLHLRVLGEIEAAALEEQALEQLFSQMFANANIRYQDMLGLLGQIRGGAFLQKQLDAYLKPAIAPISFALDTALIYGEDELTISFPAIWFRSRKNAASVSAGIVGESKEILPSDPKNIQQEHDPVTLTFPGLFKAKELLKNNGHKTMWLNISDHLQTSSLFVDISVKDVNGKPAIVFEKTQLAVGGICYAVSGSTWDRKPTCEF